MILHRLYLTAFWALLAIAVLTSGGTAVVTIHDELVASDDLGCVREAAGLPEWKIQAMSSRPPREVTEEMMNACFVGWSEAGYLHSIRNWMDGTSGGRLDAERHLVFGLSLASFVPVGLLAIARRWLRWLTGRAPAQQPAAPPP